MIEDGVGSAQTRTSHHCKEIYNIRMSNELLQEFGQSINDSDFNFSPMCQAPCVNQMYNAFSLSIFRWFGLYLCSHCIVPLSGMAW